MAATETSPRFRDRSEWGPGPWDDEPDAVSWVSAVDLPCEMRRGENGNWCGYVGMPRDHPARSYAGWSPSVHGGESWSSDSEELTANYESEGTFPAGLQWRGFDCAHIEDLAPGYKSIEFPGYTRIYRNLTYVRAECESLAAQIDAAAILSEAGFGGPRYLRGKLWTAPEWAIEYARRFHVPRAERLAMLRRLAADPVAAQLAETMGIVG